MQQLSAWGIDARLVPPRELRIDPGRLLWLEGTPVFYRPVFAALRASPREQRPFVLLWHSEPLPSPRAARQPRPRLHARELLKIALRDHRVADPYSNIRALRRVTRDGLVSLLLISTGGAQEYLAEQGIAATRVPMPLLPGDGDDLGLERDIDVLFLGAQNVPRRQKIVRRLRRAGVPVVALGGWGSDGYWGERRMQLINRTKILLNLPRHPGLLSGARMLVGMANKAVVVAEPVYRPEPYRPGEHFVSSELSDMPDAIASLLEDKARRDAIAATAYEFVHEELTLERIVGRIVELIEAQRGP